MAKKVQKSKMTLDKLAGITAREFSVVHDDIKGLREDIVTNFATKEDFRQFGNLVVDEVRKDNRKVLESNVKVVDKLDILLKEEASRTEQYKRQDKDISMLKQKVGV